MLTDMIPLSLDGTLLLLLVTFIAGFIDAIAGGGGLIVVPALMLAGLSPAQALATNKVQAVFGVCTAAVSYARLGLIEPRRQLVPVAICFAFGLAGAGLVTIIPTEALHRLLPVVMIGLALFFMLRKGLDDTDRVARMRPAVFALTVAPLIALYDGLFGPGTGSFFVIGLVTLAGYGMLRATAGSKLLNAGSNLGSLTGFALMGEPQWALGLLLAVAAVGGATLGAHAAALVGARLIRPLLVVTSSAMALKLLIDQL